MAKLKTLALAILAALASAVATPVQAIASSPTYQHIVLDAKIWAYSALIAAEEGGKYLLDVAMRYLSGGMLSLHTRADTAYQTQYRDEFIAAFEARQSLLRETVTTEAVIKGSQAVFLVAGSGSETAKTRGVNGLIPARNDDLNQNTVTLEEWHDLVRKTGFNIFASQGNQRQIMQSTSMGVLNRKIDDQIITELNTGTVTVGAASAVPSVSMFQNGRVKLSNASVPWDGNITFLSGASFMAFLEESPEFANAQYVEVKPYAGAGSNPSWRDKPMAYRWRNALLIEHPGIPGKATASEKAFMYHKTAI